MGTLRIPRTLLISGPLALSAGLLLAGQPAPKGLPAPPARLAPFFRLPRNSRTTSAPTAPRCGSRTAPRSSPPGVRSLDLETPSCRHLPTLRAT
jgi:hypothetical protein